MYSPFPTLRQKIRTIVDGAVRLFLDCPSLRHTALLHVTITASTMSQFQEAINKLTDSTMYQCIDDYGYDNASCVS